MVDTRNCPGYQAGTLRSPWRRQCQTRGRCKHDSSSGWRPRC